MKRTLIYAFLISLLLLLLPHAGYSQHYFRGGIHIQQREFKEENDSLHLSFDIQIDSRALPTRTAMIFEPEIKGKSDHYVFPYIQVNGKTRARLNRRWFAICSEKKLEEYDPPLKLVNTTKYTYESLTYSFSIPYESWMDESTLTLKQEMIGCAGELHLYTYTLGSRVATQSKEPYAVQPHYAICIPAEEKKTRNRQGSAFLDFEVGRSVILPDFRRNPVELSKINEALMEVMKDSDSEVTSLFIEGYASPEGRYDSNARLAQNRAMALKEYIKNRYELPEHFFTVKSVAEDWLGLEKMVQESDLPQRESLLQIIRSSSDPDVKEQQLKRTSSYQRLLREFFPDLRRVEYRVDFVVRDYSNVEALALWTVHPENLSQLELYRVAQSYGPGSAEYRQILMEIIPHYYDHDATAINNASALLIENGEYNTAIRLLERVKDDPITWNNLGVAYLMSGNLDLAEVMLKRAVASGTAEATLNMEELEKKRADEEMRSKKERD